MNKIMKLFALGAIACSSAILSAAEIKNHMNNHEYYDDVLLASNSYVEDYIDVNSKMHVGMNVVDKGDADRYFVESMLAHHIGAVDMAKVQLEYGKDPELRKLAEEIIKAQEVEINQMKKWLDVHYGKEINSDVKLDATMENIHKHH
jgi:uncharacterized protein (DUF305 family)